MPSHQAARALPTLPEEGVRRVLCVVAHPDDMEYGASAAVHRWASAGVEVTYLLLTAGEAGMAESPEVVGPLRAREQRAACTAVGVEDLRILSHPDGMLEPSLDLRRDVARTVREVRPDLVLTTTYEVEAYGSLNQADHRAAGMAAADGTRDAANPWVFRELGHDGYRPWQARALLVVGHSRPTHAIPVGPEDVEASIASLCSHEAYLAHVGGHPAPEDLIPAALREGGGQSEGSEFALTARVFDLGGLGGTTTE
jgi:LmbE family N-acetylglucosaminyl deacetylase